MHLAAIFDTAIKKMQAELDEARQAIDSHMAARGTSFESIFREFLKKYLPPSLDVSTGFLVDSNGNQSHQLDIIISDAADTPIFFSKETIRVVPIECAYAAIEVKARIDTDEMNSTFVNMKSVRALHKKSYFKDVQESISSTGNKVNATQ